MLGINRYRYRHRYRYGYRHVCLWSCWGSIPRTKTGEHQVLVLCTGRPFATDRELLEPEPGVRVLVPSTTGYAGPLAGNDGYPRCGGRTRLVTTPEIARVPFSRVQSACTCWYCLPVPLMSWPPDISSRRCSSPDQPGFDSFRRSRQPPPCLSGRSTFFYLPLPRALPPFFFFFFPIFLFPPSPSWGSRSLLFVPRRPHFASPLEAALLHSKRTSLHPPIPRPSSWPRLASPHLLSPRIVRRCYWTSNWADQPLTEPGLVPSSACGSPSTHRPPCRLPACVLRVDHRQSASCS